MLWRPLVQPRWVPSAPHDHRRIYVHQCRRAVGLRQGRGCRDHRRPVLRPARHHAALHRPGRLLRSRGLRGRPGLRRFLDPRLPEDPRVGHGPAAGPDHRVPGPLPDRQDPVPQLLRARPADQGAVQPRPAQHRPQGGELPGLDRDRRHRVLRARGRVLRLRRRALRDQAEHRLLRDRLGGRRLEHRPGRGRRQPRLQGALQGRLLPGPAGRPLLRPARRDDQEPGGRPG